MADALSNANRIAILGLVVFAVAGCSGIKAYPNSLAKNMHVTTQIDSGSATLSTEAVFDIHRVDAKCETQYEGRVDLDEAKTEVGIPTGGPIYLEFIFASKRFLSKNISAVRYGMTFTPRSGYDYQTQVKYIKGIYSVVIRETSKNGTVARVIDRVPLSACKA